MLNMCIEVEPARPPIVAKAQLILKPTSKTPDASPTERHNQFKSVTKLKVAMQPSREGTNTNATCCRPTKPSE